MSETAAITCEHVDVVLGKKRYALKDVSLRLMAGTIIGIIGPSGAGKTTLIRSIIGRQRLNRGRITVFQCPVGSPRLRHVVRYMAQEPSVYSDLTVEENLSYFATMAGLSLHAARQEVTRILHEVDLEKQKQQLVRDLSGGQKQRVSLGITLLGDPQLLVLDEPTVGLDPVLREELWTLFHTLAAAGKTLLISSHVMDEAERCDELVLLREGRVLAHGTPEALRQQTHTATIEQSFLKFIGDAR